MILCTLVLSQLDYVNSIPSRAPKTIIEPYQTIQNFAARVAYTNQEQRMFTHAYKNCIGCSSSMEPHSKC